MEQFQYLVMSQGPTLLMWVGGWDPLPLPQRRPLAKVGYQRSLGLGMTLGMTWPEALKAPEGKFSPWLSSQKSRKNENYQRS